MMATKVPAATMLFVAVAGEEQGLYGADHLAGLLQANGSDVQGMFTNDIVGSAKAEDGTVDPHSVRLFTQAIPVGATGAQVQSIVGMGGENDSPSRELGRFVADVASNAATDMTVRIVYRQDRFLRGGDHEPFQARGFAAARFTEPHEDFRHQHQDTRVEAGVQFGDLLEFVDTDFTARVARVNAAAMWSLANAPGTPKHVTMDTSALSNNSTLGWAPGGSEAALARYEVVWRPTDATFWTSAVDVGKAHTATVQLSKDNAVFGVRAVGVNGFASPAGFPDYPSILDA